MLQWTRFYLLTMCTSSSHPVTARTLIATLKHQEAWPSCHMMPHSVSVLWQSGPWWSRAPGDFVATSLGQSLSLSGPDKLIGLKPLLLLFLLHSNQLKCWRGLTDRFKCKIWIYPLKPKNPSEGCLVFNISSKVRLAGESPAGSSPTEEARRRERRHTGSFCWRYGDNDFFKNYYGRRSRLTQFFHTCYFHPVNTIPALFPGPTAIWESWSHHSCDCSRPVRPGTSWLASHPPQAG